MHFELVSIKLYMLLFEHICKYDATCIEPLQASYANDAFTDILLMLMRTTKNKQDAVLGTLLVFHSSLQFISQSVRYTAYKLLISY